MPRITAIVPHRNLNDLLPRSIRSIREQTISGDIEIIVVDNHSDVKPEVGNDTILLVSDTDMGLAYSMNRGYLEASSPYCAMVCADDTIEPGWFETALGYLESDPSIQFVSPDSRGELCWPQILYENTQHMGAVFRRQLILNTPYANVDFYDWDLWCRLAAKGTRGISLSAHAYNWNWREGSLRTETCEKGIYEKLALELRERYLTT